MVDYGSTNTTKIGHYAKATRLAQELIEECKHIPFKIYQKQYQDLQENTPFTINEDYYKETLKNIEAFKTENKDKIKEFDYKAELMTKKNDLGQIVEVWFQVQIGWYDMGGIEGNSREKRLVKAGNAYFNSEML